MHQSGPIEPYNAPGYRRDRPGDGEGSEHPMHAGPYQPASELTRRLARSPTAWPLERFVGSERRLQLDAQASVLARFAALIPQLKQVRLNLQGMLCKVVAHHDAELVLALEHG